MTLRKIDQLMIKLMQGDALTDGERMEVVSILAAWDAAQPRDGTGRPAGDRTRVALHYWALRELRGEKQTVAEKEVGRHWHLAGRTVREYGDTYRDWAKKTIEVFASRPEAFIKSCEDVAKLAEK